MSLRHQLTLWIGLASLALLGLVALATTLEMRQGARLERLEELRTAERLFGKGVGARLGALSMLATGLATGGTELGEEAKREIEGVFASRPALRELHMVGSQAAWGFSRHSDQLEFNRQKPSEVPEPGWSLSREPLAAIFCVRRKAALWVEIDLDRILAEERPAIATPLLVDERDHSLIVGPQGLGSCLRVAGLVELDGLWVALSPVLPGQLRVGLAWSEQEMLSTTDILLEQALLIGLLGNLVLILLVWVVSASITTPLDRLSQQTGAIARGELERRLPDVTGSNEVARLTRSFVVMQSELVTYLENLRQAIRERERLQQEMEFGARIQRSFLPEVQDGQQLELLQGAVTVVPVYKAALELAGDFLDFFALDEQRLGMVIGDVSGKGLSAGLMMARTQVLIRSLAAVSKSPADCLYEVNRLLCEDNRETMFVTAIFLVYDLKERCLTYTNAGHLPPVLFADGRAQFTSLPAGLVLGILKDSTYTNTTLTLKSGEMVLLYTDGVTEAMNQQEELFGEERLLAAVQGSLTPGACVQTLQEALLRFRCGRPLNDDLTLLALQVNR